MALLRSNLIIRLITPLLMLSPIFIPLSSVSAQEGSGIPDPRSSYDLGVHVGTFLPSRIPGVRELVPGWGIRAGVPTAKGVFEFGSYLGRGNGISYTSLQASYRLDIDVLEVLAAHFLLGLHADNYEGALGAKVGGGWHYGGGITQSISGPLLLRADFRSRFSPGNSLEVTAGIVIRVAAESLGW